MRPDDKGVTNPASNRLDPMREPRRECNDISQALWHRKRPAAELHLKITAVVISLSRELNRERQLAKRLLTRDRIHVPAEVVAGFIDRVLQRLENALELELEELAVDVLYEAPESLAQYPVVDPAHLAAPQVLARVIGFRRLRRVLLAGRENRLDIEQRRKHPGLCEIARLGHTGCKSGSFRGGRLSPNASSIIGVASAA